MSGWAVGFVVGGAVAVVVVVLLVAMIVSARRINAKAQDVITGLHHARDNTAGLWTVGETNAAAARIAAAATELGDTLRRGEALR